MSDDDWGAPEPAVAEPTPELYFAHVGEFVENYLSRIYRRDVAKTGVHWCPQWWQHAEAIARLEAIWRAWESLRLDPAQGPSNWWLGHADPHMRVLLGDDGPFVYCRNGEHASERYSDLPVEPAPNGLFQSHRN